MAERFGLQTHPSGGQRFGSQTYAALAGTVVGSLTATETGADTFFADSYPRVNGVLSAAESGADTFAGAGIVSRSYTMQAVESPTPDTFIASGVVIAASWRFGSQAHPSGGLRFGSQLSAALGPSAVLAASEAGADTVAAVGWLAEAGYSFQAFDVLASFVDYTSESLGAAIDGTLETGYKVMLPIAGPGVTFAWELNEFGNPSLRLASLTGATMMDAVPWYVWDGTAWTAALFDVSDAMQGAVFMVETGADGFSANGSETRYGAMALQESGSDFTVIAGGVLAQGALAALESGSDTFAATGAPFYLGAADLVEAGADSLAAAGGVEVSGGVAATESGADVLVAAGSLGATGAMAATESGADVFAAAGRLSSAGNLAATESGADTASMAGAVRVSGTVALADPSGDGFAAAGFTARLGALAATESGSDAFAGAGAVVVAGDFAPTDERDAFAAAGQVESEGHVVAAELDALEGGADRFVARGYVGNPRPIRTFNGPCKASSRKSGFRIKSRRTGEAA